MRRRLLRYFVGAFAGLAACATVAAAQSTRDEWLALRTAKQARHHRLRVPTTSPGALTITTIRFYADAAGNVVGVGEARNNTASDLVYSRINFRFFDSSGADLGGEWTYVFGGTNARIPNNGAYETVLTPGVVGFFKVWTTIPFVSMSTYTAASAGEAAELQLPPGDLGRGPLEYAKPRATSGRTYWPARASQWSPLVFLSAPPVGNPITLGGRRFSGSVLNDEPIPPPFCACELLTYSVRVSVAAFQDGVISDVQSVLAVGPRPAGNQCNGEPTTGMRAHESASFTIDLARPANSIGNTSVEWEEVAVSFFPGLDLSEPGGSRDFRVERQCGWTATSNVPWISISGGAASSANSGPVSFSVERNFSSEARFGTIDVSGNLVTVAQAANCELTLPSPVFLAPTLISEVGVANVPSKCLIGASTDAYWLRVTNLFDDTLRLSAYQNGYPGTTRRATVRVGDATMTVYQSPASRNTDFNGDGQLDLLWHHRTDGRVAVWRMNAVQMRDGLLLTPGRVPDTNWVPVGAGDLDRNGTTDILWQNLADGRLSFWRMAGTVMRDGTVLVSSRPDTAWKVRALADFDVDGHLDLVWQNERTGEVEFWMMSSGTDRYELTSPTWVRTETWMRGFMVPGPPVADLNWKIVGSGDFNRDGWPDLVWQHQGDGRLAVWEIYARRLLAGKALSPGQVFDLDWKIRGVGDINGDDWPDLLWQHRVTGEVGAWLMNGTTMTSGVSLGVVADTNWHIVGPR